VREQGKLDQVLSSRPEERRYLFEEAAGITRYKARSAEAERKLEKTEENMRQVEGILGEVRRGYETLKAQAEKTQKYRTLRDEIFQLELDIQLLKLKQFRNEKEGRDEDLRKKTAQRDAMRTEIDALSSSLEENLGAVNSLEKKLAECQRNIYGLALEKDAREKEARLLASQAAQNRLDIGQREERERAVAVKIAELAGETAGQDQVVEELRKNVAGIQANITSFEERIQLAASRIGENNRLVKEKEDDIRRLNLERAGFEKNLEAITDDIVTALDAGLKEAGYSSQERRAAEAELGGIFTRLRELLGGALDGGTQAEAAELAEKAQAAFERYRGSTPVFIDEFVAPQGIITRKRELDAAIRAAAEGVEARRTEIAALRKDNEELSGKINQYRSTLEELRVNRARMEAQAKAAEEQARLLRRELSGQEVQRAQIQKELERDRRRQEEFAAQISAVEAEITRIEKRGVELNAALAALEKDINAKNGETAGKQESLRKRNADLAKIQDGLEKIHRSLVEAETEIRNIQDNFRETHSRDLLEFEERILTITAQPALLKENLSGAKGRLRDLGSVNLMAPEEFAEAKERFDFLSGQLADLEKARADLEAMTREIRQESSALFMDTYNKIKTNFHNMFRRLFGGGQAKLHLADENHVLESGIEIFAQPPGKKLENITLLSGGEKSMTAVALLFATYLVKPSPFCLLDEIDAALDENNVGRFVRLLQEFGGKSQFIVITHNKKTVTGARTLLGVTMEEHGVSKLISWRFDHEAETPPAPPEETNFVEEAVEPEEGRELPPGIDDPALVSEAELRPIRHAAPA
jgi:chromosome segregation protein